MEPPAHDSPAPDSPTPDSPAPAAPGKPPRRKKLPLVAIVGRPNVGKSTLFNRIIGKARAIVHDQEGITRDRFFGEASWAGRPFRVVDTGGIIETPVDAIAEKMQAQVQAALDEARVIVFVVDGQAEPTRTDELVREALFKLNKPVVLAVNKLDNDRLEEDRYSWFELGLGEPYAISATHGLGTAPLLDAVAAHLPAPPPDAAPAPDTAGEPEAEADGKTPEMLDKEATLDEEAEAPAPQAEAAPIRVAVVGKPNVGKSSFINAILNEERTIVDDTPGTTRDAIDVDFRWKGNDYVFIDTAGLRRKAGIRQHVEHFSVARSLRAVRRADVCLIMVEANEGLSEQDKRILGYCRDHGTAMVLVWTKWDLVEDRDARFKALRDDIEHKMPFILHVPTITLSTLTRQRLFKVFELIDRVAEAARRRVGTGALNRFVDDLHAENRGPSRKGQQGKLRYITQVSVRPTRFVLFVNRKDLFHFSYLRFLENRLRERYQLEGVPVHLEVREGKDRRDAAPRRKERKPR